MFPYNNKVFIDVNAWLSIGYLHDIEKHLGASGELINLSLKRKDYLRKKDRDIFIDLVNDYKEENVKIWILTRDKKMYRHIPQDLKKKFLVICEGEDLKKYENEIFDVVLIIVVLKLPGAKAYVLNVEIKNIIKYYIFKFEDLVFS